MPELVRDEVLAANDAWVWVPDDAPVVETADYLLSFPPTYLTETGQVLRTASERAPSELVAEVLGHAREHDRSGVTWWLRDGQRPATLEEHLLSLGAELDETLTVLAKAIDEPVPAAPDEPAIRPVADRATMVDNLRVGVAVFDETMAPDEDIDREVARLATTDRVSVTLVAYLDDEPVGIGGVTVVDGAARLWGGGTVPAARRRGVYAALLRARLNWALEQGAAFALTRGRVETSAPILRREGFGVFGEQRSYRLPAATNGRP